MKIWISSSLLLRCLCIHSSITISSWYRSSTCLPAMPSASPAGSSGAYHGRRWNGRSAAKDPTDMDFKALFVPWSKLSIVSHSATHPQGFRSTTCRKNELDELWPRHQSYHVRKSVGFWGQQSISEQRNMHKDKIKQKEHIYQQTMVLSHCNDIIPVDLQGFYSPYGFTGSCCYP